MVKAFTSEIFSSTYRDDFKDSDNFHRILFNSGRALQARELTQLQTIMQSELSRLGNHIFKPGASVNPGGITVNNGYEFIKLDTSTNSLPANITDVVGVEFTSGGTIAFEVLEVVAATDSDPATLFVAYTNTSSGASTPNNTPVRVAAGDSLTSSSFSLTVQSTNTVSNPAVGRGTKVSIQAGDFFAENHFVFAPQQSKIIAKYNEYPTARIGFKVIQDIITSSDDNTLFDNQGATPNLASPGADRYRIRLVIATKEEINSDENFVEIASIRDGVVESQVAAIDNYNQINEAMALRTKEESGDYIVKPFELEFQTNDSDTNNLDFIVSAGTAYVDGYRAFRTGETAISVPKPRTVALLNNQVVASEFGNYIIVASNNKGIPNINELQVMNLRTVTNHGGTTIGTARVRHVEEDGANFRLYLFDVAMNAGQNFADVRSIGNSTSDYWNLILEVSKAVIKDAANSNLLFDLPNTRPQSLSDISLTVQRRFTVATNSSGVASIALTASGETFADTNLWVMGGDSAAADTGASVSGAGTASANITGAQASQSTYEILAYVNKSAGFVRSKTLASATQTIVTATDADSDGSGNVTGFTLAQPDIFSFDVVKANDSDGDDISSNYELDNGQTDDYYDNGRLKLISGNTAPTAIFVKYKHFNHGASGDFFAVNSYTGQVDYDKIPDFVKADGNTINLRNVIDFRPVVNSSGTFTSGSVINELPRPTDLITFDANYYQGQAAKVVIGQSGNLSVIPGQPAIEPQLPKSPENSMDIFNVVMNPYVLDDNDINSKMLSYKRFTMADIGKLEKRVSDLEETTALSLLELETSQFDVFDSAGLSRNKSGFFVDNFKDQRRVFTLLGANKSAIDPINKRMRPTFTSRNTNLFYDSDHSENTNVIIKGDNIMLSYDTVDYLENEYMTGIENVNPFAVVLRRGFMELSPTSDEWFDTEFAEPIVIDGGFVQGDVAGNVWNDWSFNWAGISTELEVGDQIGDSKVTISNNIQTTKDVKIAGISTSTTFIDEEGVELSRAFLPYMRTRKIFFKAQGLKPLTRHYPFFGLKAVDSWVKQETFRHISTLDSDYSNGYNELTQHPGTPTTPLLSDDNGAIEGSFFLPNTKDIKFTSGDKALTLIDISRNNEKDCTSIAAAKYYAQGVVVHRQQTVLSTRVVDLQVTVTNLNIGPPPGSVTSGGSGGGGDGLTIDDIKHVPPADDGWGGGWSNSGGSVGSGSKDPLAQSFTVAETSGCFITDIQVRFQSKPAVNKTPVVAQLRPMVNGQPSAEAIVPGSTVFKSPSAITVSEDGSAITTFTLEEPVYLTGNTDFCIVLLSDSKDYNVYVAEAGKFILGSTERKLSKQATLGSLFKSQNGKTWEPDQTKDLTFKLSRANFNLSGAAVLTNSSPASVNLTNFIRTDASSNSVEVGMRDHGFIVGDDVQITGASATGGIPANQLNAVHTITHIAGDEFKFNVSSNATSSTRGGGSFIIERQNQFELARLNIENILPFACNVSAVAKLTSGKSTAGSEVAYQGDVSYKAYPINKNIYFDNPKLLATKRNETDNMSGNSSTTIKLDLTTSTSYTTPVIDMQRTSITTVHNRIDQNNALRSSAETNSLGGTSLAKHVTKPITLSEKAKGLKILLSANKPSTSDFDVYFRTNSSSKLLDTVYTLIAPEVTLPADENPNIYRDYRYLPGGIGGTLNDFDQFQIKIVMKSTNNAKVPQFGDLRVIALTV
jgi:hypothetical protein